MVTNIFTAYATIKYYNGQKSKTLYVTKLYTLLLNY